MCHRLVQWLVHSCGHDSPHGHTMVDCNRPRCRYSSAHLTPCNNCRNTCNAWLSPPQKIMAGTAPDPCFECSHGLRR
ncbi:hypothetical protein C8J57DRAFT_1149768 [Mycena rebaudengoi]|nr:hypothetical protein C8J57DRAFT_1149768 [Mycena rebaudengoi]